MQNKLHRHILNSIEWFYMDHENELTIWDMLKEISTFRPVVNADQYIDQASKVVSEVSSYLTKVGEPGVYQLLDQYLKDNEEL